MKEKFIEFEFLGEKIQCKLLVDSYANNENLAIILVCKTEDGYEDWCDMTTNLPYEALEIPLAYVNLKANTDLVKIIKKYKLARNTGRTMSSGFNVYGLYEFNMDKVNEYAITVEE